MAERSTPGASAHYTPASPSNPLVQQALAFNHLQSVPKNWVMDASGQLRLLDAEGTLGPQIPIDQPHLSSFLSELAHAMPYIAAAELMGVAGAFIGGTQAVPAGFASDSTLASAAGPASSFADVGAGAATTALGPSTAANIAATTAATAAPEGIAAVAPTAATAATGGTAAYGALGPSTPANMAATTAAEASPTSLSTGFGPATSAASSLTGDLLRYALPTAGNVIGGLIQANAQGKASDAQQAYLQQALDYEKARDKAAIALEGSRYASYSGNVAPYIATGTSANTRMASLLGLPANASSTAPTVSYAPSATSTTAGAQIGAPTAPVTTGSPMPRAW